MIPLSIPTLNGNELQYVKDCIDTGWISSAGEYVTKFEESIKSYTGSKHAIACMNGTVGLQISLKLSGVKIGDLVIAPNLTFVATLNAISHVNAEAILFDINENTWQIDSNLLETWLIENTFTKKIRGRKSTFDNITKKRISAIVPVHVLGGLVEINKLIELSEKYGIPLVEDSTEALGSFINNKHAGTFGKFGVISFNGNKIISTGGGGMILTDDDELAKKAKHITTTAKVDPIEYYHDEVGYNYRLVNVLAAIGLAQMENFQNILTKKKEISSLYKKELDGVGDISFQQNIKNSETNCWLFTFRTSKMRGLLEHMTKAEIQCRPFWVPMNKLPMYINYKYINSCDVSNKIYSECISIPSSYNLSINDQKKVILEIKNFYK